MLRRMILLAKDQTKTQTRKLEHTRTDTVPDRDSTTNALPFRIAFYHITATDELEKTTSYT